MSEPTAEAVIPTEVAAPTGDSVVDRLTKSFAALENPPQVDNSNEPEPVKEEAKPEEPAKAEEPEKVEPEAEKPEGESEEEEEESEESPAFASEDELKAKWPRAIPLKNIKQAYEWYAGNEKGKEIVTSLGGEHYVKPLVKVASALQDADAPAEAFQPFFEGIVEAAGDDALRKVLGQSVYMAVVQGPAWQSDPATKDFGDALHNIVDAALQTRFGVNTETMVNLADWQSIGAIDEFSKWLDEDFLDEDKEFDETKFFEASKKFYSDLRAIQHNPKLKAQTLENLELKRQLEERKAEAKSVPDTDIENSFSEYIGTVVDTTLTKVIFAGSPLEEREGDTPEMKERKTYFRGNFTAKVKQSLMNGDKKQLLDDFKGGKQNTAIHQTRLAKAMESAITKADPDRKVAEKTIDELYGKTRNVKLLRKLDESAKEPEAPLTPTAPTNFAPKTGPKTDKDILNDLTRAFEAHDANR